MSIAVYGGSVLSGPLLETEKAHSVAVKDKDGNLMALLVRIADDQWLFSKRDDDDWAHVCARYGYGPGRPISLRELSVR